VHISDVHPVDNYYLCCEEFNIVDDSVVQMYCIYSQSAWESSSCQTVEVLVKQSAHVEQK